MKMTGFVTEHAEGGATGYTDDRGGYGALADLYEHGTVRHRVREYGAGRRPMAEVDRGLVGGRLRDRERVG